MSFVNNWKLRWVLSPLLMLVLAGCKEDELLKGLQQQQANEVIALLLSNNISASKTERAKEGYVVSVGRDDFSSAVSLLKTYNLPSGPVIELSDMFSGEGLVSSPRAERVRIYSGIEQRLSQTLKEMTGVITARVHVSYDVEAGEGARKAAPTHISALLKYDGDVETTMLISEAKRFLKNVFSAVEYENISVVVSKVAPIQQFPPVTDIKPSSRMPLILGATLLTLLSLLGGGVWWYRRHEMGAVAGKPS